jgi:uncharacterized protein (DUF305 family)
MRDAPGSCPKCCMALIPILAAAPRNAEYTCPMHPEFRSPAEQSMMMGMDIMQKMPVSGDTDEDFAMMMKMHHQQGVEMAQMELAHGKSPAMKAMVKQIIAAQKKEIAKFDQWLAKLF